MFFIFNRYFSAKTIFIWTSEMCLLFGTVFALTALRFNFQLSTLFAYDPQFLKTATITLTYAVIFYYFGLYSSELYKPSRQMIMCLMQAVLAGTFILFCIFFIFPSFRAWRGILLANMLVIPIVIFISRTFFANLVHMRLPSNRVLIIGSGDLARSIGKDIYSDRVYGLKLVGFIDDAPSLLGVSIVNPGVIGGYGDIARLTKKLHIDRIIVALKDRRAKLPMSALLDCKLRGVTIEEGETFHERATGKIPVDHLKPSWMVFSDGFKSLRSQKIMKRIFDVALSSIGLLFAWPIMALTAIAIKLESRGPVIFSQERVGENGKVFRIYKFRSMRQDAEEGTGPKWAQANDSRITRVGAFIRKVRLDELPQLVNVLKGNMSFVGPRPERPFFVNHLKETIPYYELRTAVKPGITGWAQIKYPYGANEHDALEKLQYDIYYTKNMNPLLDVMIIFQTVKVVLTGKGAR